MSAPAAESTDMQAPEAQQRLRAMLDHALEFLGLLAPDGTVLEANVAALEFIGARPGDVLGRSVADTPWWNWSPERQREIDAAVRQAAENRFVRFETSHRRADGTIETIDFSLSPVTGADGRVRYLVPEGRRIDEYKAIESELRERGLQLAAAKSEAEKANAAKSRFLAAASHDLRQPLQALSVVHEILLRSVRDPEAQVHLRSLGESIRSMQNLVTTLLDINRLETGVIAPRVCEFALAPLLGRLQAELRYAARSKNLALGFDDTPYAVRSDPQLLEVVLRNLVSNALKYTLQGSVHVGVRSDDGTVAIAVADTGIGIPPEHLTRIFEEFYQVDNPQRDQRRGLGLGLAIVQRLCALLGHSIGIESTPGTGSTFTVRVPRAAAIEARPAARVSSGSAAGPRAERARLTLLHIEDDPAVAASMRMLLRLEGFDVRSAASAEEALRLVSEAGVCPDLIVTDHQLPGGVTGCDAVRAIAAQLGRRPPTVLLTGDISFQQTGTGTELVDRVLEKPIAIDRLLVELRSLVERSG